MNKKGKSLNKKKFKTDFIPTYVTFSWTLPDHKQFSDIDDTPSERQTAVLVWSSHIYTLPSPKCHSACDCKFKKGQFLERELDFRRIEINKHLQSVKLKSN